VTVLNHKLKKPLNNPDVVDTQGTLFTFVFSAIIDGIYAGLLSAVRPHPSEVPNSVNIISQCLIKSRGVNGGRFLPPQNQN
jgi:hypothetical protein